MRLEHILPAGAAGVIGAAPERIDISHLAYDSRQARPGTLFFCVPGQRSDGHRFAEQAVAAGAVALVVERPLGTGAPEVLVGSARAAMAVAAARFNGDPSQRLEVIGITGTNGKTTTAFMVRALIEATGRRCGLIGTVKSVVAGAERPAARTTPEAIDLQADLRAMLDGGESCCALEVSSHALALDRVAGVRFAAAIFTNLTQDHLDFHRSMESYFQAKRRLFISGQQPAGSAPDAGARSVASDLRAGSTAAEPRAGGAAHPSAGCDPRLRIVNVGDAYGRRLARELEDPITFGVECEADYSAHDLRVDARGTRARLRTPDGERPLSLPLPGAFNVENALGALAAAHRLGGEIDALLDALRAGVSVPGRFQPVSEGQDFAVLVDYAHTPDSLGNVLDAARKIAGRRLLCVFGAGGDRDRGKRPLMGAAAVQRADVVVITSDNPRSEDPRQIISEVLAGARDAERQGKLRGRAGEMAVEVEPDRRAAIARAIELAEPGDVLVIAGKGHEQGQELAGGARVAFDDVAVAGQELRRRLSTAAGRSGAPA